MVPEQDVGQLHIKVTESGEMHVPPFWHGFESHGEAFHLIFRISYYFKPINLTFQCAKFTCDNYIFC